MNIRYLYNQCEYLFNQMKKIKSMSRKHLKDKHLEEALRIATTKMHPNLANLFKRKQCQISH